MKVCGLKDAATGVNCLQFRKAKLLQVGQCNR